MENVKFMFWDNSSKIMLNEKDGWREDIGINEALQACKEYNLTPLLFSSLQDVSGKDIYEGHIVQLETDGIIGVIEFKDAMFQIRFNYKWSRGMRKDLFYYNSNDKLKVIGNIYENPELLEQGRVVAQES